MFKKAMFVISVALLVVSCGVNKEIHQKALDDLAMSRKLHADEMSKNQKLEKENANLKKKIKKLREELAKLNQNFLDAMTFNDELKKELESKGASIETLSAKREKLMKQQTKLREELDQLRKMKEAAERRNREFQDIFARLKKMIDAGTLSVKIRKGRMIVSLSSDILFPPAGVRLSKDGKDAITELAETLATIEGRSFLVVGHSDSTPIRTKTFPSNWELSVHRALSVVKLLIANGVKPEMLSAAGSAEFDPVAPNDTSENKRLNRRVEIVFMPKIEEMPGFTAVQEESESEESSENPEEEADEAEESSVQPVQKPKEA